MTTAKSFTASWVFILASIGAVFGITKELIDHYDLGKVMVIMVVVLALAILYGFLRYSLGRLEKWFETRPKE